MQELYRYTIDDFVIKFCRGLKKRDFTVESEVLSRKRKGKREYLNNAETGRMRTKLQGFLESKVDVPLIRHGSRQRIEALINGEALLLPKYLGEGNAGIPMLVDLAR